MQLVGETNKNMKKLSTEEFIIKAQRIHGNTYDYTKSIYADNKTKIEIICKSHGFFFQSPSDHFDGCGCPKCCKNTKLSFEKFVERSNIYHNNKYLYDKCVFKNNSTKVEIICPFHGSFYQTPHNHKYYGCDKCGGSFELSQEEYIKRVSLLHKNLYDYSKSIFCKLKNKIEIICKIHGIFWQSANNHLSNKSGCPTCKLKSISKQECYWLNFLKINQRQYCLFINGKKYKVDGFDPKTNTVYEFLGDYWHGNLQKYEQNRINVFNKKSMKQLNEEIVDRFFLLGNAGYNIEYIWESEWDSKKNQPKPIRI